MRIGGRTLLAAAALILGIFSGSETQAGVYFEEGFEGTLTPNWSTDSCSYMGISSPANGCNPSISSDMPHSGSKSLKGNYTGTCAVAGTPGADCGVWAFRSYGPTDDLWLRFWYRTANFTYNFSNTKNVYLNTSSTGVPNGVWEHVYGSREISFTMQNVVETCPSGSTVTCVYLPNVSSVPLSDNQWYCIETHNKMNTPGQANGVIEAFVNGVQTVGYYNRTFRGTSSNGAPSGNSSTAQFNGLKIFVQAGSGYMYYDDFAAGNTRIGCGAATAQDVTAPASPSGLRIQ
ncbi:MAG: hypothetical protein P0111_06465 [Nitrospira sp.]|nr:hypothetical protein [Nitrospira sp.]